MWCMFTFNKLKSGNNFAQRMTNKAANKSAIRKKEKLSHLVCTQNLYKNLIGRDVPRFGNYAKLNIK